MPFLALTQQIAMHLVIPIFFLIHITAVFNLVVVTAVVVFFCFVIRNSFRELTSFKSCDTVLLEQLLNFSFLILQSAVYTTSAPVY